MTANEDLDFEDVLALCGVGETALGTEEAARLDERGFVVLRDVLDARRLDELRRAFDEAAGFGAAGGRDETGTRHMNDPIACSAAFDGVVCHPRVLAAALHVLGRPFRVLALGGRDPLPGYGRQGLHIDWLPRAPGDPWAVVTALWILDDFTATNGATRVLPGSHLVPKPLAKSMQVPAARHPREELVIAPAGSVLVFNGHLWHSATQNDSNAPRRTVQCQYVARELARPGDHRPVPARLSPAARALLGG